MKNLILIFLSLTVLLFSCSTDKESTNQTVEKIIYPETKKVDSTRVYHGVKVEDPFGWLEDDYSEETKKWVEAQNTVTENYLNKIPYRDEIRKRMTELWNYPKKSIPSKQGDYFIYTKNDGIQNQSVYYISKDLKEEEILIDPNSLSKDGTTSVTGVSISDDSKYAAYSFQQAGSDWTEIKVLDRSTKKEISDHIKWVKFSGASWYKDGFFYSAYDDPGKKGEFSNKNEFHKVFYHKIGTSQEQDELVYADKEHPLRYHFAWVSENDKYLILSCSEGTSGNAYKIKKLDQPNAKFIDIITDFENDHGVVDVENDEVLLTTNYNAPNYRLVKFNLSKPAKENWQDVLPNKDYVLEHAEIINQQIVAQYLKDVTSLVEFYSMDGEKLGELKQPGLGIVTGISGKKDEDFMYYGFTSYIYPHTIFKYSNGGEDEIYYKPEIDFNPDDYVSEQVFYKSKDGTKVPMFITYKKGIKMDGTNPTMLYGYGGFQISIKPSYSTVNTVFLENGGIYAVANMRGGNEYGEEWHKGGMLHNKQNVFDDFIAAAEFLVEKKYTSHDKLAIYGRSNGGLLIGAVMTQRPDIAKVALPTVGVLDMLRYHKFTVGWGWAVEYGSSDEKEHFDNLIKYSPLHNVKEGVNYPATMVITGDHDDRVVPAHSFKFAATLQDKYKGNEPMLIRIDVNAGHGSGKPTAKIIDEWTDMWSFTMWNLGIKEINK